jgi:hypothetical protein
MKNDDIKPPEVVTDKSPEEVTEERIEELLRIAPKILSEQKVYAKLPALHALIEDKNIYGVNYLLRKGINLSFTDINGHTSYQFAIQLYAHNPSPELKEIVTIIGRYQGLQDSRTSEDPELRLQTYQNTLNNRNLHTRTNILRKLVSESGNQTAIPTKTSASSSRVQKTVSFAEDDRVENNKRGRDAVSSRI